MANPLIAFALVAEEYEKSGDPIRGLKPLFAPLLAKKAGEIFDPTWFAAEFTANYGLAMSPFVAKALRERLVAVGLIERTSGSTDDSGYRVFAGESDNYEFDERKIDETVKMFIRWAVRELERLGRPTGEGQLEEAFLSRLARPGFASIFLEEEDGARKSRLQKLLGIAGVDPNAASEDVLDYLVAQFTLTCSQTAPEVFTSISSIAYGSLLADAVAGLAVPGLSEMPDPPLRVVLDSPLLLDLLDLNTSAHKAYAEGLIEMFKKAGLRIATFDHMIDEARGSIKATLSAYANKNAYGPLAERFRRSSDHRLYATTVVDSLEDRIQTMGVVILRGEIYEEARYKKYFSDGAADQIRNAIGDVHHQLDRRIRDAKSVALVARLKGENRYAGSVLKAGTIFVTRNSALAKRVSDALSIGKSEPTPRFTIATDGQIAGILWFVLGSDGAELSRRRLIANCAAALLPRREVVERISTMLSQMEPKLGEEFGILMRDERASLCPMRLTAGEQDLVDEEMSFNVLKAMREELVAPIREEAAESQERATEVIQRINDDLQQSKGVVAALQNVVGVVSEEREEQVSSFNEQLAQLGLDLELAEGEAMNAKRNALAQADRTKKRRESASAELKLKVERMVFRMRLIAYGGITLFLVLSMIFSASMVLKIVALLIALVCLPFVWDRFDRLLLEVANGAYRSDQRLIDELFNDGEKGTEAIKK